MTLSAVVIDELARAMGVDLTDGLRAALHRIEVAEAEQVTVVTAGGEAGDVTPASRLRAPSKAALRTRRWRAAKAAAARSLVGGVTVAAEAESVTEIVTRDVTEASPTVTEASPKASPVTVRDGGGDGVSQKQPSPTPPSYKTSKIPKGRKRHRHAVTVETAPVPQQIFLDEHDARFRELGVMRGRAYPVHSGGWWFDPFLVAKAEEVLASKVTRLRPSTAALNAGIATGPPVARETG